MVIDKCGHHGIDRKFVLLHKRYYWTRMHNDVEKWTSMLAIISPATPSMSSQFAKHPLEILAIDYKKLFNKYEALATKDQKASTVAKIPVKEWFCHYSTPRWLHSDQLEGGNSESQVIQELCKLYGIKHMIVEPQHTIL